LQAYNKKIKRLKLLNTFVNAFCNTYPTEEPDPYYSGIDSGSNCVPEYNNSESYFIEFGDYEEDNLPNTDHYDSEEFARFFIDIGQGQSTS